MRSRIVIDLLHAHRLCISYERFLRLALDLSKVTLNLFEDKKELLPGNLRTSFFTIGTKDNVDSVMELVCHYYISFCCEPERGEIL